MKSLIILFTAALTSPASAQASDLASLTGKYATSLENCSMWSSDSDASSAEKSNNLVEIKPGSIEWYRGSCQVNSMEKEQENIFLLSTNCEYKGRPFEGQIRIEQIAGNQIFLSLNQQRDIEYVKCIR